MIYDLRIKNQGFTLIELLVVVGIIGVLSAIVVPNFMGARERSRDTQRKSDVRQIQKALELYKDDQSPPAYPASFTAACNAIWQNAAATVTYMNTFPCDPTLGTKYTYTRGADTLTYTLFACLENKSDPSGVTATVAECTSLIKYQVIQP